MSRTRFLSLRLAPLAAALALATAAGAAEPREKLLDPAKFDASSSACADLNQYVNSAWLEANPVPGDRTSWGTFEMLGEQSLALQHDIVKDAAAGQGGPGSIEGKIGAFYATGMDEATLNRAGAAPLKPYLAKIDAIDDADALAAWLRDNYAQGQGFLFGFFGLSDFQDSDFVIPYASQGGLSLPERAYYLEDKDDYVRIRNEFLAHVQRTLELTGVPAEQAKKQARAVLDFETRLARVSLSPVELRDPSKFYNPMTLAEADKVTPHFSWPRFFEAQGLDEPRRFSLAQPGFFKELDAMMTDVSMDDWKAYLRYQTASAASPYLSDAFAEENFAFYSKALRGQSEMKPRWKRVLGTINGAMGEGLGQLYVARTFPPQSKAAALELVNNLSKALKLRIEKLDWMGEETKKKALEKWAAFTPKIGYPDKWRSWDGLEVSRDSYLDNVVRAARFNYQYQLAQIGKPVDKTRWAMTPQTVNAYYNPLQNEIVFPAAILQPPFFDALADPALNYGGIGAVIGHEMIHGYDDKGSQFDARGNFQNWWTDEDRSRFEERTGKLVQQFDAYEAIDGLHVKGELTLGENIADLGGLSVAYDAMKMATAGKDIKPVDGLTQDQRFFANWAVVWRRNFKPEELKVRLNTDSHAPANFRAIGAPSNMPAFAQAYECIVGDRMVRDEKDRVVIW